MHDVLVAEVVLEGPRVPAIVGELEATGVPEHVRMHRELELGGDGQARKQLAEASGGHWRAALRHEDIATSTVFPLEGPQRPHLLPAKLVHAGDAVLQAPHVNEPMREVDLIPGQSAKLGDAQAVPEGDQDHGGIAQAVAAPALLGGRDQPLHLLGREVFAWANILVAAPGRWHCPI